MAQSLISEALSAGRGIIGLLLGRRDAPSYFDLGLSGLMGSLIAFVVALSISAFLPVLMGAPSDLNPPSRALITSMILFAGQLGMVLVALRQYGRLDGLVPYLVCDNWATFYTTLLSILLAMLNIGTDMTIILISLIAFIVIINNARLVVTLSPIQIVGFVIAQLVGIMIGMFVIGMIFPEVLVEQQDMIQASMASASA